MPNEDELKAKVRQLQEAEISMDEFLAYILAEVLKAKPEKQYTSLKMAGVKNHKRVFEPTMSIKDSGYNQALDDYEASLIVRFGPQQGDSKEPS